MSEVEVAQSCLTFVIPWTVACQAPLSMGILQARMLEGVAVPSFRGSSQSRDQTQVFCIAGRIFIINHQGSPGGLCIIIVSESLVQGSAFQPEVALSPRRHAAASEILFHCQQVVDVLLASCG